MLGFSRLASNNSKEQRGGGAQEIAPASQSHPKPAFVAYRPACRSEIPGGRLPSLALSGSAVRGAKGGTSRQDNTQEPEGSHRYKKTGKNKQQRLSYLRFRPSSRLNCPRSRGGSQHSHPWMFRQSSPG